MAVSLQTFLSSLIETHDKQGIWHKTQLYFQAMGFDQIIYTELKQGDMEILTNFPNYWLEHYIDQEYERIDPFFTHCCANYEQVDTGIEYMHRYDYLSNSQRQLIEEAGEAGSKAGFSITFKPLDISGAGGWNLGSTLGRKEVEKIRKEHQQTLVLASYFAREALQKVQTPEQTDISLSDREHECLLWLVRGLRTKEISYRLGIRPVTVEHHLNNVKKKLKAKTREHAVAKALTLQLINP